MEREANHFSFAEFAAAYRRRNNACGPSGSKAGKGLAYYVTRMLEALSDPSKAGPRLARALTLYHGVSRPDAEMSQEDSTQTPSRYEARVKALQAIMDAIDDEAGQQAAALADALAKAHEAEQKADAQGRALAVLAEAVTCLVQPAVETPLLHVLVGIRDQIGRIGDMISDHVGPVSEIVGTDYIAERIGLTTRMVCNYVRSGKIPSDCVADRGGDGGLWKFHRRKIDAWLAGNRAGGPDSGR